MSTISKLLTSLSKEISPLDAELIMAHVIDKNREYILIHGDLELSTEQEEIFKKSIKKRQENWSVATIVGHKSFYGLDFNVNEHTLIPRPETEIIIDQCLDLIHKFQEPAKLIDVGTGSGCIAITLAKYAPQALSQIVAIDVSEDALDIAKNNANDHKVKIDFLHGDLLVPLADVKLDGNIIITANLPYLTEKQFVDEKSIQHEPKIALVADDEGLALYKKLLEQIEKLSRNINISFFIFMEIDPDQNIKLTEFIKKLFPSSRIETIRDLCNRPRIIFLKI